jgi:hypothetical protein
MWSFIQNEVQQGFLNFQFAVVFDQTQLPKFVHENIHARPRRSNQRGECVLVHTYRYRFRTNVVAIIGQQQKSPCQPHLAGIEQLVDQVSLNSGGSSQKMVEKIVGKLLVS